MSKPFRNHMQQRARTKRCPLPRRALGYTPLGPPDPAQPPRRDQGHYERRRRVLRQDPGHGAG